MIPREMTVDDFELMRDDARRFAEKWTAGRSPKMVIAGFMCIYEDARCLFVYIGADGTPALFDFEHSWAAHVRVGKDDSKVQ